MGCRATVPATGRCAVAIFSVAAAVLAMQATARGDTIFETNYGNKTIGAYTTSGATVNASLITGLNGPVGIAVSGSDLFVANTPSIGIDTIGEYTTSGATVNASLVSGLAIPWAIAVVPVPEPTTGLLVTVGVLCLAVSRRRVGVNA